MPIKKPLSPKKTVAASRAARCLDWKCAPKMRSPGKPNNECSGGSRSSATGGALKLNAAAWAPVPHMNPSLCFGILQNLCQRVKKVALSCNWTYFLTSRSRMTRCHRYLRRWSLWGCLCLRRTNVVVSDDLTIDDASPLRGLCKRATGHQRQEQKVRLHDTTM